MARLLARSRRMVRRLNPARPARIALGTSGRAAKSVVVKFHPRRLARAVREFRRIGPADLARLADGVGRGAKGVGGRLSFVSPRKTRSVRAVTTAFRRLVQDMDPGAATRVARETTRLARTTIAKLDPRRVEDAVRRVAATIDLDGKGKVDTASRGTRLDKIAKAAVIKIGPERAVRIAAEATRALKRLVDGLDPDHVGRVIGELVAAARSANDRQGRLRVLGFLASLVREAGRALKGVAEGCRVARRGRGIVGRAGHRSRTADCCGRKRRCAPGAHAAAQGSGSGVTTPGEVAQHRDGSPIVRLDGDFRPSNDRMAHWP